MSGVVKIDGWRVSLPDGEARAVEVRQQGADFWASMRPGGVGSCEPSPRTAIARLVASMGLDIAEILAPGQPSRAEISDTRGVEAMREAGLVVEADRLRHERTAARAEAGHLADDVDCLTEALAAARAIIDGRTAPPTRAEIAAHHAAGGEWLFYETTNADGHPLHMAAPAVTDREFNAYEARDSQIELGTSTRWWPLDADGRPCAWPVVTEVAR